MTGSGRSIPLGPFVGGLNTKSDPSSIAENELVACQNFDIDFDGSLKSRPPILSTTVTMPSDGGTSQQFLGFYQSAAGVQYMIIGDGGTRTYAITTAGVVTQVTTTMSAKAMVSFNGKLWLTGTTGTGGSWDGTWTSDANMPLGTTMAVYRNLIYVGSQATRGRVYYSNTLVNPNGFWPATKNFVDVGYGDGEAIISLIPQSGQLLVFRTRSIWTYSWASTPAGASQQVLDASIGLDNAQAIDLLKGVLYFVFESRAYTFLNGRAEQLNERVPFVSGIYTPPSVTIFANRVLFTFATTIYVYSTEMSAWTTWTYPAALTAGMFKGYQLTGAGNTIPVVYFTAAAVRGTVTSLPIWTITDTNTAVSSETFTCTMQTKTFDYDSASQFKRLFWWGVDAQFRGALTATVTPVTFAQQISWETIRTRTWAAMRSYTWGQPGGASLSQQTTASSVGTGPVRKFVKLRKSLRFRQLYFVLAFTNDGTTTTAPVRMFGLSTFVRVGERVSKSVN